MELNKTLWQDEDRETFTSFLASFKQPHKVEWAKKILNTKLELLAMPTKNVHHIAHDICLGNYESFLELRLFNTYESIAIYGMIVTKIKDFDRMAHYLDVYLDVMENWAHCDLLSFNINEQNKDHFLVLSSIYTHDNRLFVRRLGLMILFQMLNDTTVLPIIYHTICTLDQENEYYVIMMAGWLLSECIIKYKDQTLSFIKETKHINKKIIHKAIQKCRESRRLSQQEKDDLLQYKIK